MQKPIETISRFSKFMRVYLIVIVVIVTVLKSLLLMNEGFFYFPDEKRYVSSGKALYHLSRGEIADSTKMIFQVQGRPASVVWFTIPTAVQVLAAGSTDISDVYTPTNSYILFLFNVAIQLLISWYLYRLAGEFFVNSTLQSLSVIIYLTLDSSFKYLQHALPYDLALLLFIFVIHGLIQVWKNGKPILAQKMVFFGGIAALGVLTYPGYMTLYLFLLLLLCVLLYTRHIRLFGILQFAMGSFICLSSFELIAWTVGVSYLKSAAALSSTITQGSFSESLVFVFKYLIETEGLRGIVLLAGAVFALVLFLRPHWHQSPPWERSFHVSIFLIAIVYTAYGINGYLFNKSVNYGRLVHQYLPLLSIASAHMTIVIITRFGSTRWKFQFVIVIIGVLGLFVDSIYNFSRYVYPRDAIYSIDYGDRGHSVSYLSEVQNCRATFKKDMQEIDTDVASAEYIIVNSCIFYPFVGVKSYCPFIPKSDMREMLNEPHVLNYKGYQYEGYSIQERNEIDQLRLRLKIFKRIKPIVGRGRVIISKNT